MKNNSYFMFFSLYCSILNLHFVVLSQTAYGVKLFNSSTNPDPVLFCYKFNLSLHYLIDGASGDEIRDWDSSL